MPSRRVVLMGTVKGPVIRVADIRNPILRVRGLSGSLDLTIWKRAEGTPMLYTIYDDGDYELNQLSEIFSNPEQIQLEVASGRAPMCDVISRAA